MLFTRQTLASPSPISDVNAHYLTDEQALVNELRNIADPGESVRGRIRDTAAELVAAVRRNKAREGGIDAFLQQYDLSSEEGVLLMCIAEALLRIPDADTADRLIADKITAARWEEHLGTSESLFVNASTWGLMLTGQLLKIDESVRRRRARRSNGNAPGHGHHGAPVRHGPHDQGSAAALGVEAQQVLSLLVRYAR
jgi:RHH-type proline utilization regulon transcriptional repressor/proline dehydrogenase/delta 1-pyrroline-5-carboxylate dehydrogenase